MEGVWAQAGELEWLEVKATVIDFDSLFGENCAPYDSHFGEVDLLGGNNLAAYFEFLLGVLLALHLKSQSRRYSVLFHWKENLERQHSFFQRVFL